MKAEEIKLHNTFILSRFSYVYDKPIKDEWKSHANQILLIPGYKIYDDCDGLASTVAHYLHIKGAKQVWRVICDSDGGRELNHMVAMVQDDTGQRWIVGDTIERDPVKLQHCNYRLIKFNNINDGVDYTLTPKEI